MAYQIVILITPEGAQIYECLQGKMQATQFFSRENAAAFSSYVADHRSSNFSLVADLGDESFYGETIPQLGRRDRNLLIQRKINQQFFSSRYIATYSLNKRSSPRREEDIVLSGLTQIQTIDVWIEILKQEQVCIRGLYSPAILGAELAKNYCGSQASGLLVMQTPSGIHQILILNGKPRFARVSSLTTTSSESWSSICYEETIKTWQYIVSQRWVSKSQELPLWFLLHPNDFTRLYDHIGNVKALSTQGPRFDYRLLDLHICASTYHLSPKAIPSSDALPLLLHQAAFAPPSVQYANKDDRHMARIKNSCKALYATAATAVLCLLLAAFHTHSHIKQLQTSLNEQLLLQQQLQTARQELLKAAPQPQKALFALQQWQQRIKTLRDLSQYPTQPLYQLSKALDENEVILIDKLSWHLRNWRTAAWLNNDLTPTSLDNAKTALGEYELNIAARIGTANSTTIINPISTFATQLQRYSQGEVQLTHVTSNPSPENKPNLDTTNPFGLRLKLTLATLP